jgi:hypothetical protein
MERLQFLETVLAAAQRALEARADQPLTRIE